MGLLRSRKPKDSATDGEDVKATPSLALAPEEDGEPDAAREEPAEAEADSSSWVRLGGDALWAGVLPDDALGSLPSGEDSKPPTPADPQRPATDASPKPQAAAPGTDPLALAASRVQEPGSADFRILCGATTPNEIRRRFGWKTDTELAESYEIALQERGRAGDDAEVAYWNALVEASLSEAADRPTFGEPIEWEEEDDRREKRESARRLKALADARDALLRTRESS
jgi:hypothetical protein